MNENDGIINRMIMHYGLEKVMEFCTMSAFFNMGKSYEKDENEEGEFRKQARNWILKYKSLEVVKIIKEY